MYNIYSKCSQKKLYKKKCSPIPQIPSWDTHNISLFYSVNENITDFKIC